MGGWVLKKTKVHCSDELRSFAVALFIRYIHKRRVSFNSVMNMLHKGKQLSNCKLNILMSNTYIYNYIHLATAPQFQESDLAVHETVCSERRCSYFARPQEKMRFSTGTKKIESLP